MFILTWVEEGKQRRSIRRKKKRLRVLLSLETYPAKRKRLTVTNRLRFGSVYGRMAKLPDIPSCLYYGRMGQVPLWEGYLYTAFRITTAIPNIHSLGSSSFHPLLFPPYLLIRFLGWLHSYLFRHHCLSETNTMWWVTLWDNRLKQVTYTVRSASGHNYPDQSIALRFHSNQPSAAIELLWIALWKRRYINLLMNE